jgi:IS30 family transposase
VQAKLCVKWSPEQISLHLIAQFSDRAEMQVCHETIYQALYVQGRGHLRADLHRHLRTGRAVRRPRGSTAKRASKIPDMVLISERPAEVADRAVPGHWEGDLILGSNCRSAIATLVERQSRYTMLVHLPGDHGAVSVRDGLLATIATLPEHLRKSLTWDQGTELTRHREITLATNMQIYFCDPHSPWQRGSNENTNGLLRQYFPKGTRGGEQGAGHDGTGRPAAEDAGQLLLDRAAHASCAAALWGKRVISDSAACATPSSTKNETAVESSAKPRTNGVRTSTTAST